VGIKNLMINVRVEVHWPELSNLLREDLKEVTEWEFTLKKLRLERAGE